MPKKGHSSGFSPKLKGKMDCHEASWYAARLRGRYPTWTVSVVNIAQGLNHLHVRFPSRMGGETVVLRTVRDVLAWLG